jgi:hydroxyacylglutathione hydrolase
MTVDPQNLVLKKKYEWAKQVNQTVPSTIEEELLTNPFMRVHEISIQQHLNTSNPLETMATLRNLKDNY